MVRHSPSPGTGTKEAAMSSVARKKPFTFADFCVLVKDDQKADLIDGVIYMASPDNTDAAELSLLLARLIADFVEAKELGKVYVSRVAYRLDDLNAPEPDIGFVRTARLGAVRRGAVEGPPDLAVEVVSPESVTRDYEKKRGLYEAAGVREYWIVDEIKQKVTLLRLDPSGKYRAVKPKGGVLGSKVLPGFWLRTAWLWQQPLPKKTDILQEILGGQG
jgi:Uma2 family endonuclease